MLQDRVNVGCQLYLHGKASKIIVSGDHSRKDYDEVNTMKDFLSVRAHPEKIFLWTILEKVEAHDQNSAGRR